MSGKPASLALPVAACTDEQDDRLASLFDTHADRLYRLARRLSASADDARDLVQETFLKAARALRSIPTSPDKEEAWLVRVLVNLRRDQWRREAVRRRSAGVLGDTVALSASSVESAVIAKRIIWRALDVLSPRRRAIVVMHELEGLSLHAIAALLGVGVITVRWHLSMARRDLKRILHSHLES
jgi:RNA polymerase sigma-70 factor (ECF subfamily)